MRKTIGKIAAAFVLVGLLLSGCGSFEKTTAAGAGIGAGTGAAIGAIIGETAGGKAGTGAAVGAAVGGVAGGLIGHHMEKQKKELEELVPEAEVEVVNEGEAILVTFDSGILFDTNSSTLNAVSKDALTRFAANMNENPDTDIHVVGHTDSTGPRDFNMKLSEQRAQSVVNFLRLQNVLGERITYEGVGPDQLIADDSTKEGRAKNRRVEVYIVPGARMIEAAKQQQ